MMTSPGAALRSRAESWAQIAGLLATACVVWSTSIAPFLGRPHLVDRILIGIGIACVALTWSAVVGILLLLLIRRLHRAEEAPIIRISAVIWFAPATILLLQVSPLTGPRGMASEAMVSAGSIGSLPPIVMLLVYLSTPAYISLLWTNPTGQLMLVGCVIWMSIGIFVMKRMINFDF
jgi:hypothetical protein